MNDATQFFDTTASGVGYQIERSIRLNAPDSAFLSRTPSVAGNRKTWTWAGWVKRGSLGSSNEFFTAADPSGNQPRTSFKYNPADNLIRIDFNPTGLAWITLLTTAVFRDLSAWYHIVLSVDTTQGTDTDRTKLYVNGAQQTLTGSYVSQNTDLPINGTYSHRIGAYSYSLSGFFDGYLADIHFIDGQSLGPTSFGYTDTNGVWQPKAYAGTYGTNGFHLPFSDNSTAAALGTDTSGAGNDWTVNNISVAAGAGNDSLVDTPTNGSQTDTGVGGEVVGNYCTLNPLDNGGLTLSNGNLDSNTSILSWVGCRGTHGITSGKWYWEYTSVTRSAAQVGIMNAAGILSNYAGASANAYVFDTQDGTKWNNNFNAAYFGSASLNGQVHGVAFDADNRTITFYRGGTTPGVAYSGIPAGQYFPVVSQYGTDAGVVNFGQRPFAYPAPSGFKALCTTNLPSTTITTSGSYTGNGVADGPFVYLNGVPTAMTVGGNVVTFGTDADKLSNGFKVRTTSTTYNQNAVVYNYSITSTGDPFKRARAQSNP